MAATSGLATVPPTPLTSGTFASPASGFGSDRDRDVVSSQAASSSAASASKLLVRDDAFYVRLGAVLTASRYWATHIPLPASSGASKVATAGEVRQKVTRLERQLGDKYNHEEDDGHVQLRPQGFVQEKDLLPHSWVSVRRHFRSPHWCRGKLIALIRGGGGVGGGGGCSQRGGLTARVFLVDYGEYLDHVNVATCVRELPKAMRWSPRPLAFQVVLAGLRPLSLEIDYDLGMKTLSQVIAPKYSNAALQLIRDLVSKSPSRLAQISGWQKDARGRVHGKVQLLGFPKEVFLDELLLKRGFALFHEQTFISDIKLRPASDASSSSSSLASIGPGGVVSNSRIFSICGGGPVEGAITMDETHDFTREDLDLEQFRTSRPGLDHTVSSVGSQPAALRQPPPGYPQRRPIVARSAERKKAASELTETVSVTSATPSATSTGGKLLAALKARKAKNSPSSIWDTYRDPSAASVFDTSLSGASDCDSTNSSFCSRSNNNGRPFVVVPAGVDTGKFLEEQLRNVQNHGVGPKRL